MRSPSGIHLHNDPSMFGRLPDPEPPVECDGQFSKDKCILCSGYDDCLREEEENEEET